MVQLMASEHAFQSTVDPATAMALAVAMQFATHNEDRVNVESLIQMNRPRPL